MAKLLSQERSGHRIDRYWLHTGENGRDVITVETIEDVEPVLEANMRAFNERKPDHPVLGRHIASVPGVVLLEICRIEKISFRELMLMKTDRSISIWNKTLNNSDLRKLRTAPGQVDVGRNRK